MRDTEVRFVYDETLKKWEVIVVGVTDEKEARQAFAVVLLACRPLVASLQQYAPTERVVCVDLASPSDPAFKITPAV